MIEHSKADRDLKERVVGFVQEYYRTHGEVPSLRVLCRELNTYTQKINESFPERLAGICRASGVPIPKDRIARTVEATEGRKAEAERRGKRDESVSGSGRSGEHGILGSYDEIDRQKVLIRGELKKFLDTSLCLFEDPRMSGEVKAFLAPHLPEILEAGWGIHHSLDTLLKVEVFLDRMESRGWSADMIPEYLTRWANLSNQERNAFKELCEEAEKKGETPKQHIAGLRGERNQLLRDLEELEEKRRRDPERKALEQKAEKLLTQNKRLRDSLALQSARANCLTQAINNCQSCQRRLSYFMLKNKRLMAEFTKDPFVAEMLHKLLAS